MRQAFFSTTTGVLLLIFSGCFHSQSQREHGLLPPVTPPSPTSMEPAEPTAEEVLEMEIEKANFEFLSKLGLFAKTQKDLLKKGIAHNVGNKHQRIATQLAKNLRGLTFENLVRKNGFDVVDYVRHRIEAPKTENTMPFYNNADDYEDIIPRAYGLCYGATQILRSMNMLAIYDPENIMNEAVPNRLDPAARLTYFKKKFKQIEQSKVTVFPGYKNLWELTHDPIAARAIKESVAWSWAVKNAHLESAWIYFSYKRKFTMTEATILYKDLTRRLQLGYSPMIYFGLAEKDLIHVVQVYGLSDLTEDGFTIHIWDPNYSLPDAMATVDIRFSSQASFAPGKVYATYSHLTSPQITEVTLVPEDDQDIADMVFSLQKFCKQHPTLCERQREIE